MKVIEFIKLADSLPEALLLLDGTGKILAINKRAADFLNTKSPKSNTHIGGFLDTSPVELAAMLKTWRRTRSPIPAPIKWKHDFLIGKPTIQCQGFLLEPASCPEDTQVILRCVIGKSLSSHFVALNGELRKQSNLLRRLQQSQSALEKEHEKALVTLSSIGDAVITTDAEGNIEFLNPVAEQLTGWMASDAAGESVGRVFVIINEVTRMPATDPVRKCLARGKIVELDNHTVLISKSKTEYVIEDSAAPIRNLREEIIGVVLVFRDVTSDRLARRRLEYLAQHDPLTGLSNRFFFEQQLDHTVAMASRGKYSAALLYIDLDEFKIINDSAGHAAGDELLVEVARCLTERVRQGDTLARLGGDEFGVVLENISQKEVEKVSASFLQSLDELKFHWDDGQFDITCSIGVALIENSVGSSAEAMRQADIACYVAKQQGRNQFHIYTSDDESKIASLSEIGILNEIKDAIQHDKFCLYFQPIIELSTEKVLFHEVLIRLQRADGTLVQPGNFIAVAERYGLMQKVDEWVIEKVFHMIANEPDSSFCLNVNLSGVSIGSNKIFAILHDLSKLYPDVAKRLVLEITETTAVTQLDKANKLIEELRNLGLRFALDDFGTGFSSFAYLKHLPVDFVKIDGAFVKDVAIDPVDQAMVRSINHIAHSLGLKTVAEYVENQEIKDILTEVGVDFLQGYFIGMPDPKMVG